MRTRFLRVLVQLLLMAAVVLGPCISDAVQFTLGEDDSIQGSLNTTITAGFGVRLTDPKSSLVGDTTFRANANTAQWSNGDNGNLNYHSGDPFSTYLKFVSELLLKSPDSGYKFMVRGTGLLDFMAADTERTDLANSAERQIARDVYLLDLWVSKDFHIGDQSSRWRLGNQVINWGESIYGIGGINATNSLDFQKLLIPGTQIKEAVLPAPMFSLATGVGHGVNLEAYYEFYWNANRVPPSGTYFSTVDFFGNGREPVVYFSTANANFGGLDAAALAGILHMPVEKVRQGLIDGQFAGAPFFDIGVPVAQARTLDGLGSSQGQGGISAHWKPEGAALDMGLYFMNYHDKMPVLETSADGSPRFEYLPNRQLYGASANLPVGNWAVGWELSYRPRDAVALTGAFKPGGPPDMNTNAVRGIDVPMWKDNEKYQMHLTGLLSLTPGDYGWFLDLLRANTATFTSEFVGIYYPGISPNKPIYRNINGVEVYQLVDAAYDFWQNNSTLRTLGYPITGSEGTACSGGYTLDFNWTYDGTVIKGWQVIPGITFTQAVTGDTPTLTANYLEGAKSLNFYCLFNQNPTKWQAGINYTVWFGGDQLRQPTGIL